MWAYEPHNGPVFWDRLTAVQRQALRDSSRQQVYSAGTTLLHQGIPSSYVMILQSGTAKVAFRAEGGNELTISIVGVGDILGELETLDEYARSATVTTLSEVQALVVAGQAFRAFLSDHPQVWPDLYLLLAGRLREKNRRMIEYSLVGCRQALARVLVELSHRFGLVAANGSVEIGLQISQDELASLIWKSRHTVAHELEHLRTRGILATGLKRFTLLQPEELQRLAR